MLWQENRCLCVSIKERKKEKEKERKIAQQNNQPNFADQIQWFYVLGWNIFCYLYLKKSATSLKQKMKNKVIYSF